MFIDKKILAILALCFSAALMAYVDFGTPAKGDTVIKDRDYQLITAKGAAGGDGLYVMDERTGLMAVFLYDPNQRRLMPRTFISIADIFGGR